MSLCPHFRKSPSLLGQVTEEKVASSKEECGEQQEVAPERRDGDRDSDRGQ